MFLLFMVSVEWDPNVDRASCKGEMPPGVEMAPVDEKPEHETPEDEVAREAGRTPEYKEVVENADPSEY